MHHFPKGGGGQEEEDEDADEYERILTVIQIRPILYYFAILHVFY